MRADIRDILYSGDQSQKCQKLGPREGNPIYMKNKISKLQVNIFKWINCSECEYHTQTSKLAFLGHGNYVAAVFEQFGTNGTRVAI